MFAGGAVPRPEPSGKKRLIETNPLSEKRVKS